MSDEAADNQPAGLAAMLREFRLTVTNEKPSNLHEFAAAYFTELRDSGKQPDNHLAQPARKINLEDDDVIAAVRRSPVVHTERKSSDGLLQPAGVRYGRRPSICAESYDPAKDTSNSVFVVHPKTEAQRKRLLESVQGALLFRSLDDEQIKHVIDAMFERRVVKGEFVIKQGDDGDNFYVIDVGQYDAVVIKDGKSSTVLHYDGKGCFGELALLYNQPRAATIVALTDGILWAMDRISFRQIVLQSAFQKQLMYEQLLQSVPMLKYLSNYERINLADALVTKAYSDGERIIREGDHADGMYFIEDGQVRVTIQKHGHETEVSKISKGKYFGEKALVDDSPRTASVYAIGKIKLAFLEKDSFERLLGPCLKIMKRDMKTYKKSS